MTSLNELYLIDALVDKTVDKSTGERGNEEFVVNAEFTEDNQASFLSNNVTSSAEKLDGSVGDVTGTSGDDKKRAIIKLSPYATRHMEEVFQCPLCGEQEIVGRDKLTAHLKTHQNHHRREDGKHVCCFCSSELSSNSSLERHILTHTNYRPFKCVRCENSFTTNGNLSRHIKSSHDPKIEANVPEAPPSVTDSHLNVPAMNVFAPTSHVEVPRSIDSFETLLTKHQPPRQKSKKMKKEPSTSTSTRRSHPPMQQQLQLPQQHVVPPLGFPSFGGWESAFLQLCRSTANQILNNYLTTLLCNTNHNISVANSLGTELANVTERAIGFSTLQSILCEPAMNQFALEVVKSPLNESARRSGDFISEFESGSQRIDYRVLTTSKANFDTTSKSSREPVTIKTEEVSGDQAPVKRVLERSFGYYYQTKRLRRKIGQTKREPKQSNATLETVVPHEQAISLEQTSVIRSPSSSPKVSPHSPPLRKKNSYKNAPRLLHCPHVGCTQKFPWESSLKRHVVTHSPFIKPFQCPRCSKRFTTKSNRERHIIKVHKVDPQSLNRKHLINQETLSGQAAFVQCSSGDISLPVNSSSSSSTAIINETSAGVDIKSGFSAESIATRMNEIELYNIECNDRYAESLSQALLVGAGPPRVELNPKRFPPSDVKVSGYEASPCCNMNSLS